MYNKNMLLKKKLLKNFYYVHLKYMLLKKTMYKNLKRMFG